MKFNCCCCLSLGLLSVNNSARDSTRETPRTVSGELCFVGASPIDPANEKKIEGNLTFREASPKPEEREVVHEASPRQEAEKIIQFVNKFEEAFSTPIESQNKGQNFRNWDIEPTSQSSPPPSPPPPPPPRTNPNLFPLPEDGDDGRPKSPVPANNIVGVGFMSIRSPDQIPSLNSEIINQSQSLPAVEISSTPNQLVQSDSKSSSAQEPSPSPNTGSNLSERKVSYIYI